ncbi:hypothetical protein PR003_g33054 [Phytophthora rubi]|uniref:Uncharacterized protein n=1 Tax=Phytophthora rubi TaxID=129364 RepID=A0A6A4AXW5_9STRA|nr:hypothetical protein PR003_g33054 [Phytophthora rubi]
MTQTAPVVTTQTALVTMTQTAPLIRVLITSAIIQEVLLRIAHLNAKEMVLYQRIFG